MFYICEKEKIELRSLVYDALIFYSYSMHFAYGDPLVNHVEGTLNDRSAIHNANHRLSARVLRRNLIIL